MQLSIVIAYHNEGVEFITSTLFFIKETIDVEDYEILIIDDCSVTPLELPQTERVKIIRHTTNKGVGAAFDTGVSLAQSENIFLMASDIRFAKKGWASQMIQEINNNPKSLICCSCVALWADNMTTEDYTKKKTCTGATIKMFSPHVRHPNVINAQWLPLLSNRDIDSFEIPCILGAAYGVNKTWYNYIDGWRFHKKWGTLEPFISIKSWMFGGSCRCAPRIETGHIFKTKHPHGTSYTTILYNKIMLATLLFPDPKIFISYLHNKSIVFKAKGLIAKEGKQVEDKREEYKRKTVLSFNEFCKKWNIQLK